MDKVISYHEAFNCYLEEEWYKFMPFDNSIEYNFIDKLLNEGWYILDYDILKRTYR